MKVEVATAEIHIETIENADVPNVPTTTTDLSSWRLNSQHPILSKTETTHGRMTDEKAKTIGLTAAMTAETVGTTVETVEMIDGILAAMDTKEESGANRDSANKMSESCENR